LLPPLLYGVVGYFEQALCHLRRSRNHCYFASKAFFYVSDSEQPLSVSGTSVPLNAPRSVLWSKKKANGFNPLAFRKVYL
jgi:hypothetical protein